MDRFSLKLAMLALALIGFGARALDTDIQTVTDLVSQESYTSTQKSIENMGLGLYGGPTFVQKTRGRNWAGRTGDKGNAEARKFISNAEARKFISERFEGLGLSVRSQGRFLNIIAEQPGATHPGKHLYYLCALRFDEFQKSRR